MRRHRRGPEVDQGQRDGPKYTVLLLFDLNFETIFSTFTYLRCVNVCSLAAQFLFYLIFFLVYVCVYSFFDVESDCRCVCLWCMCAFTYANVCGRSLARKVIANENFCH